MFTENEQAMIRNILPRGLTVTFEDDGTVTAEFLTVEEWDAAKARFQDAGFDVQGDVSVNLDMIRSAARFTIKDTVPTKPVKNTPFAIGQRWYCDRTKSEAKDRGREPFTFVIIGPGHLPNYKTCRLEADDPRRETAHGQVQEYSHAHLKRHAKLVKP